jgi:hypothetical protein
MCQVKVGKKSLDDALYKIASERFQKFLENNHTASSVCGIMKARKRMAARYDGEREKLALGLASMRR